MFIIVESRLGEGDVPAGSVTSDIFIFLGCLTCLVAHISIFFFTLEQ